MFRWPIWSLACLALCGCQTPGGPAAPMSDMPCPSPNPCDDPENDAQLPLGPASVPTVMLAGHQPPRPGCPETLQVMAWLRPVAFRTDTPDEPSETTPDPSDFVCDPPEAPLLRAGRWHRERDVATR